MSKLEKIGRLLPANSEGFIVNQCSLEKIRPPWSEAVERVKEAYLENLKGKIHSIYLRGSIPRGEAREGISDIDSFAVVHGKVEDLDMTWIPQFRREFKKEFPFVTYVEFNFFPLELLLNSPGYLTPRFNIKALSVCIYGEDLAAKIPKFKPSLKLAFHFHGNVTDVILGTIEKMKKIDDPEKIKQGCGWVMKRIIRTAFGLVMEKEKVYTRDLYPAYEVFLKYYPDKEPQMRQALEWAVDPTDDKAAVLGFLNSFGIWLVEEAGRVFRGGN